MNKSKITIYIVIILTVLITFLLIDRNDKNNNLLEFKATDYNNRNKNSRNIVNESIQVNNIKNSNLDSMEKNYWYAATNQYSIAPSKIINNDVERPPNNVRWLKSLEILYPQLYNLEDFDKEQRINDIIYEKVIGYHNVIENRDYKWYNVDYKILEANENVFSILFLGEVADDNKLNTFAYAITFNVNNEKQLSLDDYLKVNENFVQDYYNKSFKVVENKFEDEAENKIFVEMFVNSYAQKPHINDFYISGKNIGIIIPTYNSMGYVLIQGSID